MKVLVDTCIWSEAFRNQPKNNPSKNTRELIELINESRIIIIGAIRQEILSGIKIKKQFDDLRVHLRDFYDVDMVSDDYEKAAEIFNVLRSQGVQGSNTDFLICAVAQRLKIPIFTSDLDFFHFSKHIPLVLYTVRN